MGISHAHLGYALHPFTVTVTPEHLTAFAKAIGERDALAAPPTFMKAIEGENNSSRRILDTLGVDLKRVLHAEQQFDYFAPIHAGDQLQVQRTVTNLYEKKGGAMEFIVIESVLHRQDGVLVGKSRQVILVRNSEAGVAA